jgi:hypothetical protein
MCGSPSRSHSVGNSAASSRIPQKLRMKRCSRRGARLWTNTDKAASEVVAVFDAVRNPKADSFHAMVAWEPQVLGLRALMGCQDVQAVPRPFSPGTPSVCPLCLEPPAGHEPAPPCRAI